jgi:2-C-methyl-D-erythritol 2,4-cyclodiphosphate synthase
MRANIANDLNTDIENISIKATTEEHLGISGSEQGMTAHCVVLLIKSTEGKP